MFPNQAWLELACEEIGGIVDWEIKSFGYICPKLPTPLCERGSVSLGYTCREIPLEVFLVYIWRQISKVSRGNRESIHKKEKKNQFKVRSANRFHQRVTNCFSDVFSFL